MRNGNVAIKCHIPSPVSEWNVRRFFAVTVVTVLDLTLCQPIQQHEAVGIHVETRLRYAVRVNSNVT